MYMGTHNTNGYWLPPASIGKYAPLWVCIIRGPMSACMVSGDCYGITCMLSLSLVPFSEDSGVTQKRDCQQKMLGFQNILKDMTVSKLICGPFSCMCAQFLSKWSIIVLDSFSKHILRILYFTLNLIGNFNNNLCNSLTYFNSICGNSEELRNW